ncbi:ATP-dependent RecD-like DNA helicase [Paenibacillus sp. HN-1]|uniref:SF1B family DNA helicase RecD2 n=1 Tax=Paenibacillus TaxID=44249 RepID=UPI001CA7F00C|nr:MULTISPECIES: ATP-dependent RecD-like DNA helicase [Paenibacillus]MBY9079600.1 ATP-dependent RecD-like DNA helicase [Paenibacillus sp. CGMCC 1.18879]MBY9084289.1 ATP-dependent RecD-like DNA helicase [Paenibacillus sinensis]
MGAEAAELESSNGQIIYFIHPKNGSLNADNNYGIAQWMPENGAEPYAIKGNLFGLNKKELVTIFGRWEHHPKYGDQFAIEHWERPLPKTKDQIASFLASKFVKGCGKKRAELIVQYLGDRALERIMAEGAGCLAGIKGVGAKNASKIAESIKDNFEIQQIMMTLLPYGITADTITKIYKQWGAECVDIVRRNPYKLTDIHLIGFSKADEIAGAIGISSDSPYRLNASLQYVLNDMCYGGGHCFIPEGELIERTFELLQNVTEGDLLTELQLMSAHEQVIWEDDRVYPKHLYVYEKKVAYKLACMANRASEAMPNFEHTIRELNIREYQFKHGIVLADKQREAIRELFRQQLLIVTGNPGTGKTTVVRAMIEVYKKQFPEARIGLCAPTGRAARKLGELTGMDSETIHMMLGFRPGADPTYGEDMPLPYDLIIVDEVSMKDLQLAYYFFQAIGTNTKVVLIGDSDQLPSVGPGNVLHDMIAAGVPHVRLTEIFRQAQESQIVMNAHRINRGESIVIDKNKDDFFFIEQVDPDRTAHLIVRSVLRFLEKGYKLEDILVLSPMKKGIIGTEELNRALQAAVNPPAAGKVELVIREHIYRQGDKVIQVRNDYNKRILNGDIGTVTGTEFLRNEDGELTDELGLVCEFQGRTVTYSKHELKDVWLAYAITIHKAQGGQAPVVIMPVSSSHYVMLARNLIYTGLTRAERVCAMIGTRKALNIAVGNNKLIQRNAGLRAEIELHMQQMSNVCATR